MKRLIVIVFVMTWCAVACAQQWTDPVRGSWVRNGAAQSGDVILADRGKGCEIVVASNEAPAVMQAARFLAGDIETISGFKPPIVARYLYRDRVAIHLTTVGNGTPPAAVHAERLRGLWEAHRIVTVGNNVWLVGSNFRGTAFAAYTLSERLGIDPLYLWTITPRHRRSASEACFTTTRTVFLAPWSTESLIGTALCRSYGTSASSRLL
jgi:hypothetical protein